MPTEERLNTWPYSSAARAERLIAVGRLVLSIFSLLTIWIDPAEPAKHAHVTYLLLGGYAGYSTLVLAFVWTSRAGLKTLRLVTHAADLSLYTVFSYLTDGATSPLVAYLTFSILCGAIRWRWRGALATAVVAIASYMALGLYVDRVLRDPTFELDRFIFRAAYLAVVAGMLATLGAYEERVRREIKYLADWPRLVPADTTELARQLAGRTARILRAPRVLLVWEEPEEPWRHVALWTPSDFCLRREPPDRYTPLVDDVLERMAFMCRDVAREGRVLFPAGEHLREWRGRPLHPSLVADFDLHSVLALPLPGDRLSGFLFCLDKKSLTSDDLTLGIISAREVVASLDHAELMKRQRETAVAHERTRLGRDLHDGLLQSLTAARLQLHQLAKEMAGAGGDVRDRLDALEAGISANQRDLRRLVDRLRPRGEPGPPSPRLADELAQVAERVRRDWGLEVRAHIDARAQVPSEVGHEVCLMIHEALVNAARHGGASVADVHVADGGQRLTVSISDNGRGFPFRGRRDQLQLAQEGSGPVSLRQRVATLNGTLVVDSQGSGACVELTIPIGQSA